MPQFTHNDRCLLAAEERLWTIVDVIDEMEHAGAWEVPIQQLRETAIKIATQLSDYNDQFEDNTEEA